MLSRRLLTLIIAAAVTLAASSAEAQRFRYGGRRGVIVRTPGVGVVVGPGRVSVNTPYGTYGYGGPIVGSPIVYGVAPYQPPGTIVDVSPTPVVVAKPAVDNTLSDAELIAKLTSASAQLAAELSTLNGGDRWQRYLALPQLAAAGDAEDKKLEQLLTRFDLVARDARFQMIAGLGGFELTRAMLRATVDRQQNRNRSEQAELKLTAPALPGTDKASEKLPTPAAQREIGPTPAGPELGK